MKEKAEEVVLLAKDSSGHFKQKFEQKSVELKELVSIWFAKADMKLDKGMARLDEMEEQNEKLEAMYINPEKLVDAKLFTMS